MPSRNGSIRMINNILCWILMVVPFLIGTYVCAVLDIPDPGPIVIIPILLGTVSFSTGFGRITGDSNLAFFSSIMILFVFVVWYAAWASEVENRLEREFEVPTKTIETVWNGPVSNRKCNP